MKTNDKLDLTRAGLAPRRDSAFRARLKSGEQNSCNHLDKGGAPESPYSRFGTASAPVKNLIGTPKRLEIAVSHSKQNTEVISNRDRITTPSKFDLAGIVAHV